MAPSIADDIAGTAPTGLARALLDAIPAHTAILDRRGLIVAVNAAWQGFSDAHCGASCLRRTDAGVGTNYLDTCRRCVGLGADQGLEAAHGIEAVLAGRTNRFTMEYACHGPEERRWFVLEARPLGAGDGGCLVTHWDITQRKADMDALRESRDMYQALVQNSLDAVLLTSPDGRILAANPAACEMFGRPEEELLRATRNDLFDGTDLRLPGAAEERERTGRFRGELRFRRSDGRIFPGEATSAVFTDRTGQLRTSTVIRDISRRRRAESALRASEARYRHLFDSMAQGAFLQRADGALIDINAAGLELLGLTRDGFLGRTASHPDWQVRREDGTLWPPEEFPSTVAGRTGRPVVGQTAAVFNPRRREFVWFVINAVPHFRPGEARPHEIFVTLHDITDLRKREADLAALHERLELALAGGNLGTYDTDLESGRSLVNRRYLEMLGDPPGETGFDMREWLSRVHPDDLPGVLAKGEAAMVREGGNFEAEYRMHHRDGRWIWVLDRGRAVDTDGDDRRPRVLGTLMEITRQKQADLELRASEARYRSLVESSPDAICVIGDGRRLVMVNDAAVRMFGATRPEDLTGRDALDLVSPEFRALGERRFAGALAGQRNPTVEARFRRLDGTGIDVEATSSPFSQEGRQAVHLVLRDIGERKRAEAKIAALRAELGQMAEWQVAAQTAAAIAHDINQPLNAVTTYGEAARRMLADWNSAPPRLADALAGMTEQAARAGTVVKELLASFHGRHGIADNADLRALAEESIALVAADAGGAAVFSLTGVPAPILVRARRTQIRRALVNLLRNAADATVAMPEPRLGIEVNLAVDGTMARLSIIDRGPGLSPDSVKRLFQPFFTTKPGGIGMGLAISRSLLQASDGRLWYEPAPGGGAVFRFTLPLA